MANVFYENLIVDKYNLLLAYTKDYVVELKFNTGKLSRNEFLSFLNHNFDTVVKNNFKSDYGLIIENYLTCKSKDLDIPVKLIGTDFNKKVWEQLIKIPFGKVKTYGEIAKEIGNEKASRAVGNANNRNNIVIIVPCHRVVGSDRNLVGYAPGLSYKIDLLENEGHKITKKGNAQSKKILYYVD